MTTVHVDPADPHNDQMLAMTKEDLARHMNIILSVLEQAEGKEASLPAVMAVVTTGLVSNDNETRERLASLLALSLIKNHAHALQDEDSSFAQFVQGLAGR